MNCQAKRQHRPQGSPLSLENDTVALDGPLDTPCRRWRWCKTHDGYGLVCVNGRKQGAHRAFYELLVGPIPPGLTIDHLCRVRDCQNPDHLEVVTMRENLLRGNTFQAKNAAKTHCQQGHAYDAANTYKWRGRRDCRTCRHMRVVVYRAAKLEAAL